MGDIVNGAAGVVEEVVERVRWAGTAASGTIYGLVSDPNENLAVACGILCRAHDKAWKAFLSEVTGRFLAVVDQPEAKAGSDAGRDSGVAGDGDREGAGGEKQSGQAGSATRDGGEDVEEKPRPKPADPLRWFGILTPLPLRQAQGHSIKAVEVIIPRLATLSAEMAGLELEVRRARKRRAKAEKAEEKRIVELEAKMEKVDVGA